MAKLHLVGLPGVELLPDYNYLNATVRFQEASRFGSCSADALASLTAVLAGQLGLPAANVTTSCAQEAAQRSHRRRGLLQNTSCASVFRSDLSFRVDPSSPWAAFRDSLERLLEEGGACPLQADGAGGDWADVGGVLHAAFPAGGSFSNCTSFRAAVLSAAAMDFAASDGGVRASVAQCRLQDGAAAKERRSRPWWAFAPAFGGALFLALCGLLLVVLCRRRKAGGAVKPIWGRGEGREVVHS